MINRLAVSAFIAHNASGAENTMRDFWLCFVPLFIAVDPVGVLPIFIALTEGIEVSKLRIIILQSVTTALAVALAFVLFGSGLLQFLGITVADFMVAGGILLLVISLNDLLTGEKRQRQLEPESLGAVPLGVPLIAGPAVLTTCVLLASTHGKLLTAVATLINISLAGIIFLFAEAITKRIGHTGTRITSKITSMLLAAIAVMLVRKGIGQAILSMQK